MKEIKDKKRRSFKKSNKIILIIGICLLAIIILGIALNLQRNVNNSVNKNSSNNVSTNDENEDYDHKIYKVGNLYFEDLGNYMKNYEPKTKVEYTVIESGYLNGMQGIFNGEIMIEKDSVYLRYEKDNAIQNKKINIGGEKPKYVMVITINAVEYIYILTMDGNVYLNTNADNVDAFLNFSKVNNLINVSNMFMNVRTPYFIIDNHIYNKYGEIAHNNILINEDLPDLTGTGYVYYMQVGNDGLLYKNIIKETAIVGTPESTNSILTHQKQENELFKDSNNENILVSVLFNINDDTYLIDTKGNYYKVESLDDKEIKLDSVNSKKVTSVDKYSKFSVVQKIRINYSDGTKETYSLDTIKSMW